MSNSFCLEYRAALGFRLPAEWEPHEATWLIWPQHPKEWPGPLEPVERCFARMACELSQCERVQILVNDEPLARRVWSTLAATGAKREHITTYPIPTNDCWIRDCGPLFLVPEPGSPPELALLGFRYNAWGGKFAPYDLDAAIPRRLAETLSLPLFQAPIVLEGGAIDSNGAGVILTTEQCARNRNRNPGLDRRHIEAIMKQYLGARKVVWLDQGLVDDHTDGHVDNLARFADERTIFAAATNDRSDENYSALEANLGRLLAARDLANRPFRIVPLPLPARRYQDGRRLPASYLNFYVANEIVLLPVFGCPQDAIALDRMRQVFSGRRVVGIEVSELLVGGGGVHCVTQPQPATSVAQ
jgi:agmatine deiminase